LSFALLLFLKLAFLSLVGQFTIKLATVDQIGVFADVAVCRLALHFMLFTMLFLAVFRTAFIANVEGYLFHLLCS
jgi:hypothetical protein